MVVVVVVVVVVVGQIPVTMPPPLTTTCCATHSVSIFVSTAPSCPSPVQPVTLANAFEKLMLALSRQPPGALSTATFLVAAFA